MSRIKKLIKTGLHHAAPLFGRHRIAFHRHNLLILTYHRVLPANDQRINLEQPGMYVTPESLAKQITLLKKHFCIMKLTDWLEHAQSCPHRLPKRACAITFDDGWQDNYNYAFPVLKQESVPASIFLVSSLIGSHYDFWPGRLARLLQYMALHHHSEWSHPVFDWLKDSTIEYSFTNKPPTPQQLDQIINRCKQYSDTDNQHYIDTAAQLVDYRPPKDERTLLNEDEINTMLRSNLIEIGSHTARHIRMSENLTTRCLQEELIGSKLHLEKRFGVPVRLFCYPNGDTSPAAISIVKQHYLGACTTRRGWNTLSTCPHTLNRISIHEDMTSTEQGLLAKISAWL